MEPRLPPPGRRRLVAGVALLAVVLVLAIRQLGTGGAAGRAAPPLRAPRPAPVRQLVVDVAGAVRRPGLYRLREGSRIADAVARAGGGTARAELALVNLAAPLADGEQIVVPARASASGAVQAPAAPAAPSPSVPLDLNTASAEQLDALPGIGPATAAKILEYRQAHGPFRSVDELDGVPGIGPARVAQLKGLVLP